MTHAASNAIVLPKIEPSLAVLEDLSNDLNVRRGLIARSGDIERLWRDLPEQLSSIPEQKRDVFVFRMCVAIQSGLFDSAINYIWNAVVQNLREQIRSFGSSAIANILDSKTADRDATDLRDCELITLCEQLSIISEEGAFFLRQCLEIRNAHSAAHPSMTSLTSYEVGAFIDRCSRYGLQMEHQGRGVNFTELFKAVKSGALSPDQLSYQARIVDGAFAIQKQMIIKSLFGMYCDPNSGEAARNNALGICRRLEDEIGQKKVMAELLELYRSYFFEDDKKRKAAEVFFEKLGLTSWLPESERIARFSRICKSLRAVHHGMDNFYNEEPYAERLYNLARSGEVPDAVKEEYVEIVTECFVGNRYGTAISAEVYYEKMIRDFSPLEVVLMLKMHTRDSSTDHFSNLIHMVSRCESKYQDAIGLISPDSISGEAARLLERWNNRK